MIVNNWQSYNYESSPALEIVPAKSGFRKPLTALWKSRQGKGQVSRGSGGFRGWERNRARDQQANLEIGWTATMGKKPGQQKVCSGFDEARPTFFNRDAARSDPSTPGLRRTG